MRRIISPFDSMSRASVWLMLALSTSSLVHAMEVGKVSTQDSLVVDGRRFDYEAAVDIDSILSVQSEAIVDWWFGMAIALPSGFADNPNGLGVFSIGTNRPSFRVERHQTSRKDRGSWGIFAMHYQPWTLVEQEVSPHVKGWVVTESGAAATTSIQQVVLIPDSLAFERDTIPSPLSPGHALRVGGSWESKGWGKWHTWVSFAISAFRPPAWTLSPPGAPDTWRTTTQTDTYVKAPWMAGRSRMELGANVDLGKSYPGRRSASQLRLSMFLESTQAWGACLTLLVSPTRR